jgi:hypothetical protein
MGQSTAAGSSRHHQPPRRFRCCRQYRLCFPRPGCCLVRRHECWSSPRSGANHRSALNHRSEANRPLALNHPSGANHRSGSRRRPMSRRPLRCFRWQSDHLRWIRGSLQSRQPCPRCPRRCWLPRLRHQSRSILPFPADQCQPRAANRHPSSQLRPPERLRRPNSMSSSSDVSLPDKRFGDFPGHPYPVKGRDIPSTFQGIWEFDYRMQRAL